LVAVDTLSADPVAINFTSGEAGNQDYAGSLGTDFTVNYATRITQLGVFDDDSDGIVGTLTAQIWNRDGNTGTLVPGTTITFTNADPGTLDGGVRLKPLATSVVLAPGTYTLASYGHSSDDKNLNPGYSSYSYYTQGGGPATGSAGFPPSAPGFPITFENQKRYARNELTGFPSNPDGNHLYGGGTFAFRGVLHPGTVNLFGATANYSQPTWDVYQAIDQFKLDDATGWAVLSNTDMEAVFQAVDEVGFDDSKTELTFVMDQDSTYPQHLVNNFRLAVTTDPNPEVGSGATWTLLEPDSLEVFSIADGGVVAETPSPLMSLVYNDTTGVISGSGSPEQYARYVIKSTINMTGITGFRLETGYNGASSGFGASNFVLTNFAVSQLAVPEPSSIALAALGLVGLLFTRGRRQRMRR
jgi:hypothetical protein